MSKDIRVISSKVNYITDRKTMFEIEKYLLINEFKLFSFGEILFKVGFDVNKNLYLKRINDGSKHGLGFYYSYDKNDFSNDNFIKLGYVYTGYITICKNGMMEEYHLSRT